MFEDKLKEILALCEKGNNFGEQVTLVGATKTMDADVINKAVSLGLKVVAENKAQEFRDKKDKIVGATHHFIGHLQANKVKYVVGKVELIHSVDNYEIASEIDNYASKLGIIQNVLAEINIAKTPTKSGFMPEDAIDSVILLSNLKNINVVGLMAMLPITDDKDLLASLTRQMRSYYDKLKKLGYPFTTLSVGMSADYEIAINNGSNAIRIGSSIFGKRNYEVNN